MRGRVREDHWESYEQDVGFFNIYIDTVMLMNT